MTKGTVIAAMWCALLASGMMSSLRGAGTEGTEAFDARVRETLAGHNRSWGGMNVPEADGRALYDLVVRNNYKRALEIGTSNGYSGIWIAWALSKTGGKLITVEIDPGRHREALGYFARAGLDRYIDARLGDAHEVVPALEGPFDFVFCDADKEWYTKYLEAVLPKLTVGGIFAAHNVSEYPARGGRFGGGRGGRGGGPAGDFLEFARSLPNLETSIADIPGSAGLCVSRKTK